LIFFGYFRYIFSLIMRLSRFVVCLSLILQMGLLASPTLAARGTQKAPKLLNLFFNWQIAEDDPAKLAKWDVVVLDMDQQGRYPSKLREIKRLNPNIKLLAYVSAGEIATIRGNDPQSFPGRRLVDAIPEAWYLHRSNGERISWWTGNYILNATNLGPQVNGQRWQDFLGPFIRDQILSTGLWDGVFLDSAYADITPFAGIDVDLNEDRVLDPPKQNDQQYQMGMRTLVQNVRRAVGPNYIIMNNSSASYASISNGVLFENFPRDGWPWPFAELRRSLEQNPEPKVSAVNTNTNNRNNPLDYRLMRYGLMSALIADGYFSFDAGDAGHDRTWWYDEYDVSIGVPRAAAKVVKGPTKGAYPAVWSREYSAGTVLVNSTNKAETISLGGEYERLTGTQDPMANNGQILSQVTVPPQDGIMLLRRKEAQSIRAASFINGTFFQIYTTQGSRTQNGFFANRDDVSGGSTVSVVDLDRDGTDDVVSAQGGSVSMRFGNGKTITTRPFGAGYKGAISLAVGQTNRDASLEVVVVPLQGAPATVVILNTRGAILRQWLAYRRVFTGGATVALGDIDGDGLNEIVTGPGSGGGPHIQIFRTDGQAWGGAFFAFDSRETGGARVAIGDIDGDGRAEIVVGSGPGTLPRVQVYDKGRVLRAAFSLGNTPSPVGIRPVVADVDGDGKAEILIPSSAF
jgi:hypothetical protein